MTGVQLDGTVVAAQRLLEAIERQQRVAAIVEGWYVAGPQDQGAIVRPYVKWDAQPASPAAAREALLRAKWLARTAPSGPVYVNLDAGMQEAAVTEPLPP